DLFAVRRNPEKRAAIADGRRPLPFRSGRRELKHAEQQRTQPREVFPRGSLNNRIHVGRNLSETSHRVISIPPSGYDHFTNSARHLSARICIRAVSRMSADEAPTWIS